MSHAAKGIVFVAPLLGRRGAVASRRGPPVAAELGVIVSYWQRLVGAMVLALFIELLVWSAAIRVRNLRRAGSCWWSVCSRPEPATRARRSSANGPTEEMIDELGDPGPTGLGADRPGVGDDV